MYIYFFGSKSIQLESRSLCYEFSIHMSEIYRECKLLNLFCEIFYYRLYSRTRFLDLSLNYKEDNLFYQG